MAKKSVKLDPLDSVRIPDPAAADAPADAPKAPPSKPSKPKASKKEPKPQVAAPTPPPKVTKYTVTAMARRSYRGQIIVLKIGKVVSAHSHGQAFIDMLKKTGVPLKELE